MYINLNSKVIHPKFRGENFRYSLGWSSGTLATTSSSVPVIIIEGQSAYGSVYNSSPIARKHKYNRIGGILLNLLSNEWNKLTMAQLDWITVQKKN
jgi:hypothetical protein